MYQRPEGLSHLIAPQMRPEECGLRRTGWKAAEEGGSLPPPPPPNTHTHTPFFTVSVAFLKGYIQGHVTFRGLNKKKRIYSIAKCAFLFILLVWAFKAGLVAVELARRIPVSHFSLVLSVLSVPFDGDIGVESAASTAHTEGFGDPGGHELL